MSRRRKETKAEQALRLIITELVERYAPPWKVSRDWAYEVQTNSGLVIVKCITAAQANWIVKYAERIKKNCDKNRKKIEDIEKEFRARSERRVRPAVPDGRIGDPPNPLAPKGRDFTLPNLEESMKRVVFTYKGKKRWTASHLSFSDFSAQGTTKAECAKNARANMVGYLMRITKMKR